jgi:hypothetical protein
MDRRGRVERVLYEHLDVLSAPEAQDGFEDGRGIAERLSGPSFVEFVEAWHRLEVNDVSLTHRVDQAGYRQPTSATRSFAPAETRIQCDRRSDNARPNVSAYAAQSCRFPAAAVLRRSIPASNDQIEAFQRHRDIMLQNPVRLMSRRGGSKFRRT